MMMVMVVLAFSVFFSFCFPCLLSICTVEFDLLCYLIIGQGRLNGHADMHWLQTSVRPLSVCFLVNKMRPSQPLITLGVRCPTRNGKRGCGPAFYRSGDILVFLLKETALVNFGVA